LFDLLLIQYLSIAIKAGDKKTTLGVINTNAPCSVPIIKL